MIRFFAFLTIILCAYPVYGQNARVTDSERVNGGGLSYPLLDTLRVVGSQISYTRSFPVVSAKTVAIRILTRGITDSLGFRLDLQVSSGDSVYSYLRQVASVYKSGAGNDTTVVNIVPVPNYMMRARFLLEGQMEATDTCKVSIDAVRGNEP